MRGWGIAESCLAATAFFVFFARSARAVVVAVYFDGRSASWQIDFDLLAIISGGHCEVTGVACLRDVSP